MALHRRRFDGRAVFASTADDTQSRLFFGLQRYVYNALLKIF